MGKPWSIDPQNPNKACKARGDSLRVHYKNTHESAMALKGRTLNNAIKYLEDVLEHKQAIPYRRHNGGVGRHKQANMHKGTTQVRWPEKSCKVLLGLLHNLVSNAEFKQLEPDTLKITHIQVNRAVKNRRRTYRAHGRINPYMSHPCHVQIIAEEQDEPVPRAGDERGLKKR